VLLGVWDTVTQLTLQNVLFISTNPSSTTFTDSSAHPSEI